MKAAGLCMCVGLGQRQSGKEQGSGPLGLDMARQSSCIPFGFWLEIDSTLTFGLPKVKMRRFRKPAMGTAGIWTRFLLIWNKNTSHSILPSHPLPTPRCLPLPEAPLSFPFLLFSSYRKDRSEEVAELSRDMHKESLSSWQGMYCLVLNENSLVALWTQGFPNGCAFKKTPFFWALGEQLLVLILASPLGWASLPRVVWDTAAAVWPLALVPVEKCLS